MAFSAADVKNLREQTGVGMMECKKALVATDGDMEKAVDWLREKGLAAAQKKAARIAAEGMAYAEVIDGVGVCLEVNAESDFVGKNELFVNYVKGVAEAVAKENPADLDALMACKFPGSDMTIQEMQNDRVLVIGENIKVRRFKRFEGGVSVSYVHMGGKIAVLVNLKVSAGLEDKVQELGKDLAMQIAALNPAFLDKSQVDQATLDKEKEILLIQAKEENAASAKPKPDAIVEKMVMGRMSKYYKENCLMQQEFVKDNTVSVEQYVKNTAKTLGGTIELVDAVRFEKGEGIEKRQDDLAAEVAKMIK